MRQSYLNVTVSRLIAAVFHEAHRFPRLNPYIMNRSLDPGFMYLTIKWFVDMACFSRQASDRIACNIDAIFAQSQGEMLNLMKTKPVNFTHCTKNWI